MKKLPDILKLMIAIVVSEGAGILGSLATTSKIPTWYATLEKPALNPPSWVFGPVWTTLYALMGIAMFLVWRKSSTKQSIKTASILFGTQLAVNTLWSIIFFGFEKPGFALITIAVLWILIVLTMKAFFKISKTAAYLLIPYLLWVSFASYLNYAIWSLN
jgi:benzodiazapine receptor